MIMLMRRDRFAPGSLRSIWLDDGGNEGYTASRGCNHARILCIVFLSLESGKVLIDSALPDQHLLAEHAPLKTLYRTHCAVRPWVSRYTLIWCCGRYSAHCGTDDSASLIISEVSVPEQPASDHSVIAQTYNERE